MLILLVLIEDFVPSIRQAFLGVCSVKTR